MHLWLKSKNELLVKGREDRTTGVQAEDKRSFKDSYEGLGLFGQKDKTTDK